MGKRHTSKKFYNKCSENSRSQIVFRTDIFRRLTLGAPIQLSLYKSFRTSSFTIVYVFAEKAGLVNVGIADIWRES